MTTTSSLGVLLLASATSVAGCAGIDDQTGKPEDDGKSVEGKAEQIDGRNNPDRFGIAFNYKLAELPGEGKAEVTPWPDTYWPTYKDSTNQRWQGST